VLAALAAAAPASAGTLRAGVGRADITPRTGYYMMGWVRSDAVLRGQHTRLFARAIVLERDGSKVALVAMDVNAISGGAVAEAAEALKDRGFSAQNILVSASHTHAAPTGWYTFYRLASAPFAVGPSHALTVDRVSPTALRLAYPAARANVDLTDRPAFATGGRLTFVAGGRRRTRRARGETFSVPAGATIERVEDRYGNMSGG
jgi:hypothetical protein